MQILFYAIALLAFASCEMANGQQPATNTFAVHAEIMPRMANHAKNVAINPQSITACFDGCDIQVTLLFSGMVRIEREGKEAEVYRAEVFQLQPGEWLADLGAGQYVKIYSESGTLQMDIAGEFKTLIPARSLQE